MYFLACNDQDLLTIVKLVKTFLNLIQWIIPIILIILGTIDLGKAVIASKDDEIKKAQSMLIKRIIYAVAIFFVVLLVKFIFKTVGKAGSDNNSVGSTTSWIECWDEA